MAWLHLLSYFLGGAFLANAVGLGMLALGLVCARHFGRFHGGNASGRP